MRCLLAVAAASLTALVTVGHAEEAPKPEYNLKQEEPRIGTRIRRNEVSGSGIALNLPYTQLSLEEKRALHSWWENVQDGDEPPFPAEGLRALYDPLRKAHAALRDDGELFAVASIGSDGNAIEVKVFNAPSKKMAQLAAHLLLITKFKPAVCSGQPCRMDYPVRMTFTVTR